VVENGTPEAASAVPPSSAMSTMSDMAVSPASVASSNHFPFTPSDISGMGMDASALDTTFASDVVSTGGLQLGPDGGIGSLRDSARSLGQLWDFSLTDLTADLTNLGGNLMLLRIVLYTCESLLYYLALILILSSPPEAVCDTLESSMYCSDAKLLPPKQHAHPQPQLRTNIKIKTHWLRAHFSRISSHLLFTWDTFTPKIVMTHATPNSEKYTQQMCDTCVQHMYVLTTRLHNRSFHVA